MKRMMIWAALLIAAAMMGWPSPASAQLDEWRQSQKAAYDAQLLSGMRLDAARSCGSLVRP